MSEYEEAYQRLSDEEKEFVAKKMREFNEEMKKKGIGLKAKPNNDGEAEAEKLRIEMDDEAKNFARKAQLEQDLIEIRDELRQENKKIPAGVTKLGPAQTGGKAEGYPDIESMIDDLHRLEHSDNPEAKKYANQVLNELFRKSFDSIKRGELNRAIVYEPKEGKSTIRKVLDEQNERMRRKILKTRGEEDENS